MPGDVVCRVVRCQVGRSQVEALAGAGGRHSREQRRAALHQAVMTSAWSRAMPGEPAAGWLRVVQPIRPPLEEIEPEHPLLVLVAGLRRVVAEGAERGEERAGERLIAAREAFGEPERDQIAALLAHAVREEEAA